MSTMDSSVGKKPDWPLARPIGLCLDALICVSAPYQEPLRKLWARGGLHSRFEAFYRLLHRYTPGITRRLTRLVLRDIELDGRSLTAEPMDRGRAVTVYRLAGEKAAQALVLKVYRSSLGLHGQELAALRANIQLGKDQLERWYGDSDGLLVPVQLLMTKSPILGIRALALLQPLVSTAANDFFRDYSDAQLLQLMRDDNLLREQFNQFVAGTRAALQEGTRCFDMHGQKNLALITTPEGKRLCIVDYGVYDLEERKRKAPVAYAEIVQLHQRLFTLHEQTAALPH